MNKLSELKDGSAFFYNDLTRGEVIKAVKVGATKDSKMLIGEFDVMTLNGPTRLSSMTEVYPTQEMAKVELKHCIEIIITSLKNKIQGYEEQLRIYENALVKVTSDESN